MARLTYALLAFLLSPALALPHNSLINLKQPKQQNQARKAEDRAQAVIDAFRVSWEGYYEHAFPNDELHPVSNTSSNSRYETFLSTLNRANGFSEMPGELVLSTRSAPHS